MPPAKRARRDTSHSTSDSLSMSGDAQSQPPLEGDTAKDAGSLRDEPRAGWKALFNFTTRKHLGPLCAALISAVASGAVVPVRSELMGKIFDQFARHGGGTFTQEDFKKQVIRWCLALVGLGAGSWLLNCGLFFTWILFGELQARSVRERLFSGLLVKEMAWYDTRTSGIGAMIPRLQTWVTLHRQPSRY